jgi:hypothetical protein
VKNENPTGWTAYVTTFKARNPDTPIDYKTLMQQYIKGVKLEDIK